MNIAIPTRLEPLIQDYATANGYSINEACDWLLKRGLAVYRSEQTEVKIPTELQGIIVSDYHTVSGWARFNGIGKPLLVPINNLMEGMTPEEFLDAYQSNISPEDIAKVQSWMKTLPRWDRGDRDNISDAYRFMMQEEGL